MSLNTDEKQELAKRIAMGVQVVCSSVAQLHLGSPDPSASPEDDVSGIVGSLRNHGSDWKFTNIEGALLLIRDQHGYCYFRIYDLDVFKLRFHYELYENLEYMQLNKTFHAFEMENCVCGFNFADEGVARKFFERVAKHIVRKTPSEVVNAGAAIPAAPPRNRKQPEVEQGVVMLDGTLDPNNIPSEWKKILRKAGIRKKDLKNPQMTNIIKEVLAKHNISIEPPRADDPNLQNYYTAEQLSQWKQYNEDMKKYEQDRMRYEREMDEYERSQAREAKLQRQMAAKQREMGGMGGNAEERIRASVKRYQGKDFKNILPAAAQLQQSQIQQNLPRMSVARPLLPALPVVPKDPAQKVAEMKGIRQSKVMMKANFISDLKKEEIALRHVSVLPSLKNVGQAGEQGIMGALQEALKNHRQDLGLDEESDEESDFESVQ